MCNDETLRKSVPLLLERLDCLGVGNGIAGLEAKSRSRGTREASTHELRDTVCGIARWCSVLFRRNAGRGSIARCRATSGGGSIAGSIRGPELTSHHVEELLNAVARLEGGA